MKHFRFLFLVIGIFITAFFFSGGTNIFNPQVQQNINNILGGQSTASSADRAFLPAGFKKLLPDLSLRHMVETKIDKTNYITIDQIPPEMTQAIIAVEDSRFYSHHGFDPESMARAFLVNMQSGQIEEGASTITQQLVKNLFLSHEQSFGRKAKELALSLAIEHDYSKDEILEMYLNTIYFGSNYYGIEAASEGYFGKEPNQLALPEAAMLAGLPNAPSIYSPYNDFLLAKKRQFIVLDAMNNNGYITKAVAEDAKIKPIYLAH